MADKKKETKDTKKEETNPKPQVLPKNVTYPRG